MMRREGFSLNYRRQRISMVNARSYSDDIRVYGGSGDEGDEEY